MASTAVEICNRALDAIGATTITSLADTSRTGLLCARYFPQVRDDILRSHPWNCATARAALTADETAPAFGPAYRFALPDDCLRVLSVEGDSDPDVSWQIEAGFILTDESEPLNVVYIAQPADTALFDPLLVSVIAARLAMELAMPLTASPQMRQQMEREFLQRMRAARSADGQEGTPQRLGADEFGLSRL